MERVFIAIGSNVGDRMGHVRSALRSLARLSRTTLVRTSAIHETAPMGTVPQGPYLNAVAELSSDLSPRELLDALQRIEREAGRPMPKDRHRWGPRTLDLDILLFGGRVIDDADLVVPHPHMHQRRFVLEPLAELDADLRHPQLGVTVGHLLARLEDPGPDRPPTHA